jgi:hypothetical protein
MFCNKEKAIRTSSGRKFSCGDWNPLDNWGWDKRKTVRYFYLGQKVIRASPVVALKSCVDFAVRTCYWGTLDTHGILSGRVFLVAAWHCHKRFVGTPTYRRSSRRPSHRTLPSPSRCSRTWCTPWPGRRRPPDEASEGQLSVSVEEGEAPPDRDARCRG